MTSRRDFRRRGFTILEILIAIVILVLGISGIIALFPTAIEAGNQTVQDSYAASITQSVVDAIAVGLRESRYRVSDTQNPPRPWVYFIFDHDGVYDPMTPTPHVYGSTSQISESDWCILLPQGKDPNTDGKTEPWFVYPSVPSRNFEVGLGTPQSLPGPYDNRTQSNLPSLPNTGDNMAPGTFFKNCYDGRSRPWIRRVYMLGRYRSGQQPASFPARSIREEFLGDPEGTSTSTGPENRPVLDPYPQYSFAFAMKRAKIDNVGDRPGDPPNGKIDDLDTFSNTLYEVRIFVFRNFDASSQTHSGIAANTQLIPRFNVPIREFVTLMSL